jgi:hypothetical protein
MFKSIFNTQNKVSPIRPSSISRSKYLRYNCNKLLKSNPFKSLKNNSNRCSKISSNSISRFSYNAPSRFSYNAPSRFSYNAPSRFSYNVPTRYISSESSNYSKTDLLNHAQKVGDYYNVILTFEDLIIFISLDQFIPNVLTGLNTYTTWVYRFVWDILMDKNQKSALHQFLPTKKYYLLNDLN